MISAKPTRILGRIVVVAFLGMAVLACYAPSSAVPPEATLAPSPQVEPSRVPPPAVPPQDGEPSTPLLVSLTMDKAPRLGEAAQVVLEMTAYRDAPGTSARIELPAGATLVSGDLDWKGDVLIDTPVRLTATIKFDKEGVYTIHGSALRPVDGDMTWGDAEDIFLTVREGGSFFGLEDGGAQLSASPVPTAAN